MQEIFSRLLQRFFPQNTQGYRGHAIAGFSWQTMQKVLTTGLTLVKIFVLARLLSPNDFGLFSLTMIALGISESFTQTGINITMIQSAKPISYFLNTAWVIAIIRGFLIGILMLVLALLMSSYYQEEALLALIMVTAVVPVIKGFINPAITAWQKNFDFFHDNLYSFWRLLAEVFFQVLLALILRSVWALALGLVLAAVFEVLLSFAMLKQRPVFLYLKSRGAEIFHNARFLNLASLLHYLNDNVDDFLIGKIAGTSNLGIYHNAYTLSHKTNYELSKSAHYGVLPIFSQIAQQKEEERLAKAFKKAFFTTLILVTLVSLPILLFPSFFVLLILGEQWLAAIPLVPLLVIGGLIHAVSNFSYSLMVSKKQYFYFNSHLLLLFVLTVAFLLYFGRQDGLQGAVFGIVLARAISLPIALLGIKKSLSLNKSS